ncbi:MAG: hypothetical protein U5K74_08290 [Gemmatimonadaceae bacterium]|nr:hypothetical protein [Gemmatimonadaceae bacterium]
MLIAVVAIAALWVAISSNMTAGRAGSVARVTIPAGASGSAVVGRTVSDRCRVVSVSRTLFQDRAHC